MSQADPSSVKFYAYIASVWVELDDAGGAQNIRSFWGMNGNGPLDRVADPGDLRLPLNNSGGLYTPGGPSALAGFKKGIPLKMVITFESVDHTYRYYIDDIDIKPNTKDKLAYVYCVGWMDYASRHPIVNPGIQSNKRGDEVLTTAVTEVEVQPTATDYDTGRETFETVFDTNTSHTTVLKEAYKVAFSEVGFVYEKHDGTLVFESADARYGWRAAGEIPLANADSGAMLKEDSFYLLKEDGGKILLNQTAAETFDGTIIKDFDAPYGDNQINRMTVYAYPRRLSAAPEVLFQLDKEIVIGSGQTYTLKGTWADPDGGLPINAQDVIEPDPSTGTDCSAFTATSGGGSDITSDLTIVTWTAGTEGFTAVLRNDNAATMYLYTFAPRGTGIYQPNPITHVATNSASITEYEAESETLHQKYQNTTYSGAVFVDSQVEEHKDPRTVLRSITFTANKSPGAMMAFLHSDVGDLRYIEITELGITGNYYIQGIEVNMKGKIITVTWIVAAALSLLTGCGLSPLAVEFPGGAATDVVDFGYVPCVSDLTQRSFSIWIYLDSAPVGTSDTFIGVISAGGGTQLAVTTDRQVQWYTKDASEAATWKTPDNSVPTGAWTYIRATRDVTNILTDPIIHINNSLQTLTEAISPATAPNSEVGAPLVIGNVDSYDRALDGKVFDPRIYDYILTDANGTAIYNSGTPSASVGPQDMVFQGFAVRTGNLADFVDVTMDSTFRLLDAQHGVVGRINGAPIGRAAP